MKKNYIAPALNIENIEIVQNLMLTVSTESAFTQDDTIIADGKVRFDDASTVINTNDTQW